MMLWLAAGTPRPAAVADAAVMRRCAARWLLALLFAMSASLAGTSALAQPTYVGVSAVAIATTSGSTGTVVVSKPVGVTTGDMLLVQIAVQGGSGVSFSVPSGWALTAGTPSVFSGTKSSSRRQVLYYKVATSSEPASYTFTYTRSSVRKAAAVIVAYRGTDTSAPFVAGTSSNAYSSNKLLTTGATTSVANSQVIYFFSQFDGVVSAMTPSSGTSTLVASAGTGASNENEGVSIYATTQTKSAAGSVGGSSVYAVTTDRSGALSQTLVLAPYVPPVVVTASGFNAFDTTTSSGITGNIQTKVAGQSFNLALIAINSARTAVLTSFTGNVRVDLLNATDSSGSNVSGSNCRSTWTLIQTLSNSLAFANNNNGRVTLSGIVVANAYRNVRIRVTSGATSGCSTDAFAIRPSAFSSPVTTDADWRTAGTTRALSNTAASGGVVHAAGQPFRITANAVNAASVLTTGYDGTPSLVFGSCVLPSICEAGVSDTLVGSFQNSAGVVTATDAEFGDVGVISFTVQDSTFAAVDATDGSTAAQRLITSPSVTVGRFVPDSYLLELTNVPQLLPAQAVGCTSRTDWNFTWIGQPFTWATVPVITVTAQDANGSPVQQYAGSLYKLTTSAVSLVWASNAPAGAAFSATGQTATLTADALGVSTLTLGSAASFQFARPTSPVSPFNAVITLTINIADTTEAALTGNGTIAAEAALVIDGDPLGSGTGIEFQGTNAAGANLQTYGRLQLAGANGDSRRPLSLVYETQAWSGAAWYRNQRDSCFTLAATNVALSSWTGNTTTCDASVSAVTQATRGQGVVKLSAPLGARSVGATATLRLNAASGTTCVANASASATGAAKGWLQGPWTSATGLYNTDPAARVTWGRVRNDILMRREQ